MSYIENSKQYTGKDLANTFFIPMLTGESAKDLAIRVLYNMPVPTVVTTWTSKPGIMHKFTSKGWVGGQSAEKKDMEIPMTRIKAENAYSAAEYFSMVYEKVSAITSMNMEDLSGTELEKAETELFRKTLQEEIRATMWLGDTTQPSLNTFDGLLKPIFKGVGDKSVRSIDFPAGELKSYTLQNIMGKLLEQAPAALQHLRSEGHLAFFATSDLSNLFETGLNENGCSTSYTDLKEGIPQLSFRGIPIIDLKIGGYTLPSTLPKSFIILTDRRNLVLAVNTADLPGNEVRMWYNPDEMENRQRAVFMAGCGLLSKDLVMVAKTNA